MRHSFELELILPYLTEKLLRFIKTEISIRTH